VIRRVRIVPEATQEIAGGVGWYEARSVGLGKAFLRAVDRAVVAVRDRPAAAPISMQIRGRPIRRKGLGRFPFDPVFLEESEEALVILAVAHQRRRPGYWRGRS
jgi:hypothetical protein